MPARYPAPAHRRSSRRWRGLAACGL